MPRLRLLPDNPAFNFLGRRKLFFAFSAILMVLSVGLYATKGLNYGIDFTGGTEVTIDFADEHPVEIAEVREVLGGLEVGNDAVQQIGDPEDELYIPRVR